MARVQRARSARWMLQGNSRPGMLGSAGNVSRTSTDHLRNDMLDWGGGGGDGGGKDDQIC